jgi:MoaA/NifB/PqqE/SkfB family radical SAM enzyme
MEFSKLFPPTLDGTVYVEITHRCNYSCKHCYANCPSNEEMSFEKIKKLSKILKKQGFKKILLTGGEPLLAKHISDTINLLSKDFKVILITNGTLIRDVNVNYKKLSGVYISYDKLMETFNSWEAYMNHGNTHSLKGDLHRRYFKNVV